MMPMVAIHHSNHNLPDHTPGSVPFKKIAKSIRIGLFQKTLDDDLRPNFKPFERCWKGVNVLVMEFFAYDLGFETNIDETGSE